MIAVIHVAGAAGLPPIRPGVPTGVAQRPLTLGGGAAGLSPAPAGRAVTPCRIARQIPPAD